MQSAATVPEAVMEISQASLLPKAAMTLRMNACDQAPIIVPKMQDEKSLTLHWCSFSSWGMEAITISFANQGGQWLVYALRQPIARQITQNARPK